MTMKPRVKLFRLRAGAASGAVSGAASGAEGNTADAGQAGPLPLSAPLRKDDAATEPAEGAAGMAGKADAGQTPEQEIAAIRREGLTGAQLRMARRVAQRHGLAPSSDHDAVRLLRRRGIDPFKAAGLFADGDGAAGPAAAPREGGLPQLRPGADAPPPAPLSDEAARLREIARIQADIARRRRRKVGFLALRLAFFVALPTLLAGLYYGRIATPLFATHSEFLVQRADAGAAAGAGGLGGLMGGAMTAAHQDAIAVQSYLESREAMQRLDADHGFRAHFSSHEIDPLRRLGPDATDAEAYRLYERSVRIGFDPTEGLLRMEVIAASPESSAAFSRALLSYAEERVEGMTRRLRDDQMSGARASYDEAEARVRAAQDRVLELQIRLGVLDPASETTALMGQIAGFEQTLREKRLELAQLLDNPRPNAARVDGVRGEIARLTGLISELRAGMTREGGAASLARITAQLRIAEADLANRQALLQQALQQLEAARIEANRQVRYLSVGVNPVVPDAPAYPRVAANTLLAFLIAAGIYLVASMTVSILREQVSS